MEDVWRRGEDRRETMWRHPPRHVCWRQQAVLQLRPRALSQVSWKTLVRSDRCAGPSGWLGESRGHIGGWFARTKENYADLGIGNIHVVFIKVAQEVYKKNSRVTAVVVVAKWPIFRPQSSNPSQKKCQRPRKWLIPKMRPNFILRYCSLKKGCSGLDIFICKSSKNFVYVWDLATVAVSKALELGSVKGSRKFKTKGPLRSKAVQYGAILF